jgi:glycosyltransferase involved in cell wall biosynthesis
MLSKRARVPLQMTNPARILFAIPELDSGGPDRVFFELISRLDRSAFLPILLVSRAGGRYYKALPDDVEICVLGGGRYPVWSFARAIDRLKPDLIIATLRMNITASAARCLQRHRPPLITRQANAISANFKELRKRSSLKYGFAEWLVKLLLKAPDALIAQSSDMGKELEIHASPRQRIVVIGNPVDVNSVRANCLAQHERSGPAGYGDPALIAVGRLAPQKGFDLLLQAFAGMRREYPRAGLTILGEGPDRHELKLEAKRLGIEDAFRLPGQSNIVLAEVDAADLFVSSSRYEGFSNAILEAMALGKPVVATNCEGGTKDMVIDGHTGLLAQPQCVEALTEALLRAMHSDLSDLGKAAQQHIAVMFSHQRILTQYEALFQEILMGKMNQKNRYD